MKILQTCAAGVAMRPITAAFRNAGCEVILADMDVSCLPVNAEKLPGPEEEKEYIKTLELLAEQHGDLLVYPHNDQEALLVTRAIANGQNRGWTAMLSAVSNILSTQDKFLLVGGVKEANLPWKDIQNIPACKVFGDWEWYEVRDNEKMLKPRQGCGSQGILTNIPQDYLLCTNLRTHGFSSQEFTVDIVAQHGKIIDFAMRGRLKSHGGICVDALVMAQQPQIERVLYPFVRYFGLHGPLAVQGFLVNEPGGQKFYITDCNHRFGGGVGMSIMAGWRGIENYVRLARGEEPVTDYAVRNIRVRRWFIDEVIEDTNDWTQSEKAEVVK